MEDFVADEQVQTKFLSVAQGRPGFGQLSHDQCMILFITQPGLNQALLDCTKF